MAFWPFKVPNYTPIILVAVLILCFFPGLLQGRLKVGFYSQTCPDAEAIINSVVQGAVLSDTNMAPVLLRLHFHDCFVQGCDGSILIDNVPNPEKSAFGHQGVGGFDVIEQAKAQLEAKCPGVVSCADIVALAARDAIALSRGPFYQVPTGRRDARVSNRSLADDMPDVTDSAQLLKEKFLQKGLSVQDLVLLSAAHTIGTTACFFMTHRLYEFSGSNSDPSISPQVLPELQSTCPKNGDVNVRLPMDRGSGQTFDAEILQNIRDGFAVLESDARLYDDEATRRVVDSYFGVLSSTVGPFFETDFVESMVKMGRIGVITDSRGRLEEFAVLLIEFFMLVWYVGLLCMGVWENK